MEVAVDTTSTTGLLEESREYSTNLQDKQLGFRTPGAKTFHFPREKSPHQPFLPGSHRSLQQPYGGPDWWCSCPLSLDRMPRCFLVQIWFMLSDLE